MFLGFAFPCPSLISYASELSAVCRSSSFIRFLSSEKDCPSGDDTSVWFCSMSPSHVLLPIHILFSNGINNFFNWFDCFAEYTKYSVSLVKKSLWVKMFLGNRSSCFFKENFENTFYRMLSRRKVQADVPSPSHFSRMLLCFQNQVQSG